MFRNIVVARMGVVVAPGGVENRQDTPTFVRHLLPPSSGTADPGASVGHQPATAQPRTHEHVRRAVDQGVVATLATLDLWTNHEQSCYRVGGDSLLSAT